MMMMKDENESNKAVNHSLKQMACRPNFQLFVDFICLLYFFLSATNNGLNRHCMWAERHQHSLLIFMENFVFCLRTKRTIERDFTFSLWNCSIDNGKQRILFDVTGCCYVIRRSTRAPDSCRCLNILHQCIYWLMNESVLNKWMQLSL